MIVKIEGFSGYFVSDDGEIYCNLGRGNRHNGKIVGLYKVKQRMTKNGYARVYVKRDCDGKRIGLYVHRIVAQYFVPKQKILNGCQQKRILITR